MSKELPEHTNGNIDPFAKLRFGEGFTHSKKGDIGSESLFQRFFQKMGDIFKRPVQLNKEHPLSGRISELHTSAAEILVELIAFKQRMENESDPQLYSFICSIIDPIIKEVSRIQQSIEREGNTAQKVKSFSRYVDWIEKAREWVEFDKLRPESATIRQAVIKQTIKDFQTKIDRDIQVVQDYLNQAMGELDMTEEMKNELKEKLMPELSPSLRELYRLRQPEKELSLEEFIQWRSHSDQNREKLFGVSLHIIDTFAEEFLPSPVKEIETGHALASITQLNYVEARISELAQELEDDEPLDETRRKNYLDLLVRLDEEIHDLNGNLHLSHDQHERLQQSIESLVSLREKLSIS